MKKVTPNSEKLPSFATVAEPNAGLRPAPRPVKALIAPVAIGRVPLKRKKPRSPLNGPPLSCRQKLVVAACRAFCAKLAAGSKASTRTAPSTSSHLFITASLSRCRGSYSCPAVKSPSPVDKASAPSGRYQREDPLVVRVRSRVNGKPQNL